MFSVQNIAIHTHMSVNFDVEIFLWKDGKSK